VSGVALLITSSVYAHCWPSTYKDAPRAPGLVLSANVFTNTAVSALRAHLSDYLGRARTGHGAVIIDHGAPSPGH
jgi:hypothetical protein